MAIGDPYISRAEFKTAMDITSSAEDDWIDRCLQAARKGIENRSGWPTFWNTVTPVTRQVNVVGRHLPVRSPGVSYTKVLLRSGIASATGFVVTGYGSPVLMPEDSFEQDEPADAIRLPAGATFTDGRLGVAAIWGWPVVPPDIIWANHMQTARLYRRKGSPEGIAGSAEWGLTRIPPLDPDVLSILKGGGYMRAGIG